MASTQKKSAQSSSKASSASQSAPKLAAQSMNKTAAVALSAVESTRNSAETFVKMGADTVKEFFASGTDEASKAHEKAFAISRESTENLSRVVDAFSRTMNDMVSLVRENADAAIEVCHITSDISKTINSELVSCANNNFVDNVELCKDACACRNMNDMIDIQNKWFNSNMESFFSQSARIAEMCFQLVTEASEPISERVAETTERFSKSMAA
jgi:hypothetical protein